MPLVRSDENERDFPEGFPACAVTRAMATAKVESVSRSVRESVSEKFSLPLSDFPVSLSHSDLVAEQQADSTLKDLFDQFLP